MDNNTLGQLVTIIGEKLGCWQVWEVDTVLATWHANDDGPDTLKLNFYPKWRGAFGQKACATYYINNGYDRVQFETHAGIKTDDLIVSDFQVPPQRKPGSDYPWENPCHTFRIFTAPQEEAGKKKEILVWEKLSWGARDYTQRMQELNRSAESDPPKPIPRPAQTTSPGLKPDDDENDLDAYFPPPNFGDEPEQVQEERPVFTIDGAINRIPWTKTKVLTDRNIVRKAVEIIFGTNLGARQDDMYYVVLMKYDEVAGRAIAENKVKRAAHEEGLSAAADLVAEFLLAQVGEQVPG